MGKILRAAQTVIFLALGISVILISSPLFWIRAATGIFVCGLAIRSFAIDRAWVRTRDRFKLSSVRTLRIAFALYWVAGLAGGIAAFSYLDRAGAIIAAFFLVCWMWGCGWVLWRSSSWTETSVRL
jgi:hypothetical protein